MDRDEAKRIIEALLFVSDKPVSAETLKEVLVDIETTEVTFRDFADEDIVNYVQSGAPMDKAGAYGIQDQSAVFVEKINGDFYNVVGLPISKIYQYLHSQF